MLNVAAAPDTAWLFPHWAFWTGLACLALSTFMALRPPVPAAAGRRGAIVSGFAEGGAIGTGAVRRPARELKRAAGARARDGAHRQLL